LVDPRGIRAIPGPYLAKFSDAWLGWVSSQGHRSEVVHEAHRKHGTFVRLAPNHVSIADPDALQVVYAHGNGALKSNFYDAFVSIQRGVFNTRDRHAHARKRKLVSHMFSQKNIVEFEPHIRLHIGTLIKQWDRLYEGATEGLSGTEGEGGWKGQRGRLWLDSLPWFNYLAFDIIGDLAFGEPFGMLQACKDSAWVAKSSKDTMNSYGQKQVHDVVEFPAAKILNDRGEYAASMGVLPPWWRPFVRRLPWYSKGNEAVKNLAGMAVVMVARRLATTVDRNDLLAKLQQGKDDEGNPMGPEELTAEALTQLIAGSDTTANSSCAIIFHIAHNPVVQDKLHRELDEHLGTEDETVSTWDQVKKLPYLEAVINEGLRIHSTSSVGLPRVIADGGLTVAGKHFPPGTILSVPSYTIHRNVNVWGDDVEVFRPERWFEQDPVAIQKTFNPFSFGPRACVGRNLASMELLIIISSILRRYHFVLEEPDKPFETREGFLRKPLSCKVGIQRREF
jgi:benzoate 4-monooxygenase